MGKMEDNKQEWRLNLESLFHEMASISADVSLQKEKFSSESSTVHLSFCLRHVKREIISGEGR